MNYSGCSLTRTDAMFKVFIVRHIKKRKCRTVLVQKGKVLGTTSTNPIIFTCEIADGRGFVSFELTNRPMKSCGAIATQVRSASFASSIVDTKQLSIFCCCIVTVFSTLVLTKFTSIRFVSIVIFGAITIVVYSI